MNAFDAWCDGFKNALSEMKEQCMKARDSDWSQKDSCDHLIAYAQELSKNALSRAPTLEIDSNVLNNALKLPCDRQEIPEE